MIEPSYILVGIKSGLKGVPIMLYLTFGSLLIGSFIGLVIALIRCYEVPVLSKIVEVIIDILKGVPIMTIILIIYLYGTNLIKYLSDNTVLNYDISKVNTTNMVLLAMIIMSVTKSTEIFRGAFYSIEKGQIEAASAMGYSTVQMLRDIIIPQMFIVVLPMMGNLIIGLMKASSLASVIAVTEIVQHALSTASTNFKFLEAYLAVALIYWAFSIIIEILISFAEKKTKKYT